MSDEEAPSPQPDEEQDLTSPPFVEEEEQDVISTDQSVEEDIYYDPMSSSKDVMIDKLLPGVKLKQVVKLALQFGPITAVWKFRGPLKERSHYIFSFVKESEAEDFVNSYPSINGQAVLVSLYHKEISEPERYFDCENEDDDEYVGISIDILTMIFEVMDSVELIKASMVCKMWYNLAMHVINTRRHLTYLPKLAFDSNLDDVLVKILPKLNLTSLDLSNSPMVINDRVAKAIIDHCPNLTKFSAKKVVFKKRTALNFFANIPNITHLNLQDSDAVDQKMFKIIMLSCEQLEYLNVSLSPTVKMIPNITQATHRLIGFLGKTFMQMPKETPLKVKDCRIEMKGQPCPGRLKLNLVLAKPAIDEMGVDD